jgi:hypothetical protein
LVILTSGDEVEDHATEELFVQLGRKLQHLVTFADLVVFITIIRHY